jgi:flagellar hook-associated protein 3 FlgL
MAISDLMLFDTLASSLDSVTSDLQTTQIQLASGKRVNNPSDDPVAYGTSVVLNSQISALNNDVNIAQQIQGKLNSADGALSSASNAIDSALSLAAEAADLNASQMAALVPQVSGLISQVIGAANLQYNGAYVFGGNKTLAAPYSQNGTYSGDSGSNVFTFSSGGTVQLSFDGQAIFGNSTSGVIGALTSLQSALTAGDQAGVAAALTGLQAGLQTVATTQASIGADEATASTLVTNTNAQITTLTSASGNLVDANLAQLAAKEQTDTAQEQALVSFGSALNQLPLINIVA